MSSVRRLTLAGGFLALATLITSAYVWGEVGAPKKDRPLDKPLVGRDDGPPAKIADDLAKTKFSNKPLLIYETQDGTRYYALQVKPKLEAPPAQPRDLALLVDTSASQVHGPMGTAQELVESIVAQAGPNDRISIWTVNIPTATKHLTSGFKEPKSAAVKDAVEALRKETPFGSVDLKNALSLALKSFDLRDGRQRAIVYLGNGMSVHNPVSNTERSGLIEKLVANEVAVFPVPVGPRTQQERGSSNLHGFATGTGGLLVRHADSDAAADTAHRLSDALNAPILYTRKFQAPAEATEVFPAHLPPLRTDVPTLVVGKMKAAEKVSFTVEGTVAGKLVKVTSTETVPVAEVENFFLPSLVAQWQKADHDMPALIRADRALARAFEENRLARDELLAQAQWAVAQENFPAANDLFRRAKDIDPNDPEADAGLRIVDQLKNGVLDKEKLRKALSKPTDQGVRIEKGKVIRGQMGDLIAQVAGGDKKPDAPAPAPAPAPGPDAPPRERDDFIRQEKARVAIEEQRITGVVRDAERQANRLLNSDPDAAHDLLKRTLLNIRDNPDLTAQTRQGLANRLEASLRNVDTNGARIKIDLDQRLRAMADAQRRFALEAERERGEELIRRKINNFVGLMNTGRFEEAVKEAVYLQQAQLDKGAPIPAVETAAYNMSLTAANDREANEIRRQSEQRFVLTLMAVDKSHIPFPDEPPVQFPPTAVWQKITDRRKGIWDVTGLDVDDPQQLLKAERLKKKLSDPINLKDGIPQNSTLKDAIDYLQELTQVTLIPDVNALSGMLDNIPPDKVLDQQVQLRPMIGVSFSTVLRMLLGQVKGNRYTATYLIRGDYVEITSGFAAAAEKTVRAYPVADLVIPIPNAVNQQALQQNLQVYGQFQQSQNPFQLLAMQQPFGAPFGQPFGQPGAQPQPSPFAFNPANQPGFNQYGGLAAQFGLQGKDKSYELLTLVTKVVAPGEWQPLGPDPNRTPTPPGFGPGPLPGPAQPPGEEPTVDKPLLNGIDYYEPARALIVRGSSRIHYRVGGGFLQPGLLGPNAPPMGAVDKKDPDVKVAGVKDQRDRGPFLPGKDPKPVIANIDAKTCWQDALATMAKEPKADHTGLVIATAEALVWTGKYEHAAEFLKANLRLGIVTRPWVYEALSLALQLSNGSPDEIERAQVSSIDLEPTDAQGYLRAAKAMLELKRPQVAVNLCRQAALMQPNTPEAYANALVYAEASKDTEGMAWAVSNLLQRDWPLDNDFLHSQARQSLTDLTRSLEKDGKTDVQKMLATVNAVKVRDLTISLSWTCAPGDADLDLKVKEPIGAVCSWAQRQTPGGGTLLGDTVSDGNRETYIASEAFSGDYEVTVERVRGQSMNNKAYIDIVRFEGTAQQVRERHVLTLDKDGKATLKVKLTDGRRTMVAMVPPTPPRAERIVDDPATPMQVLNKLRAATDPEMRANGGMTASGTATGGRSRMETQPMQVKGASVKVDYQTRLPTATRNGAEVMAQQVIDPKTGQAGLKLNPVFQTINHAPTSAVTNSLIPGGY